MNPFVMNLNNGAVTEYPSFAFDSMTSTHIGSENGLYSLGGDTDNGAPILGTFEPGLSLVDDFRRKQVDIVFLAMKSTGSARLVIKGEKVSYPYTFPVVADGVSRCKPGRGIRENYLGMVFSKPDGAHFQIDQIEVIVKPVSIRRTK